MDAKEGALVLNSELILAGTPIAGAMKNPGKGK